MSALSTLSVKFSQGRCTCVLDPALALSAYGVFLVKQLAVVMDVWLGREFWHIIDNTHFYLQHPELLLHQATFAKIPEQYATALQDTIQALKDWQQVQQQTDFGRLQLYRIGDRPGECILPHDIEPKIIWQYEFFARSLEEHISPNIDLSETLSSAFQDTIALAATLGSSFILTYQLSQQTSIGDILLPEICTALENWQISCQAMDAKDEIVTIERNYLRQIIIQAGLAKILWSKLQLTILHLLVPTNSPAHICLNHAEEKRDDIESFVPRLNTKKTNLWDKSQSFWYQL
ncbi:hypothetical protein [Nostoc sp. TCL26-01]|uniref:hypothetical protein n=1 Tax=Nostoc sp. TCL26-01 TaxID=2576904 RepID=UPI0015BCCA09|nr:hypothetical protein [Nostoc sp. TCL26-01]QLE55443.1 hypothetical protein FD725_07885 [Nostoc sp. TCL26-01]